MLGDAMTYRHILQLRLLSALLISCLAVLATAAVPAGAAVSASGATEADTQPVALLKLVKIVRSPLRRTSNRTAVFRMKRVRKSQMRCRIDKRRYRRCSSRVRYRGLPTGRHVFRVRARRNGHTTVQRHRWSVMKRGAPLPRPNTKLRFADNFDGTALDTTQWSAWNSPGYLGHGLRRRSAFAVRNGMLVLTAQMVNGELVSGGMAHRGNYTYGRYEFRVRTEKDPTATMSGIVMTWPKHQRSPEFTENDIYETGPVADRSTLDTYIHYGSNHTTQKLHRHKVNASEWHTMVMDWRKDELLIYRDGKLAWAVTDRSAIPDVLHHMGIQLDARHDRVLKQPVRMFVDYVRIYE